VPGVQPWQRARVLLRSQAVPREGQDAAVRALMYGLPPSHVITVLLALRRMRRGNKRLTRAAVAFVLEHPDFDTLVDARRPALTDILEHALGKATARGCARLVREGATGSGYLHRHLLRFVADPGAARERLTRLYSPGVHGAPAPVEAPVPLETRAERPATVTPTNRGDLAATLVHLYRGGPQAELRPALGRHTRALTGGLPRFEGHLALVLDTSPSMRGYGEREWAVLAQAFALRLVLAEVCARLTVVEVGARGETDLASGVLDALEHRPDLVAVVSDGYENACPGDLARVAATLPRAGIDVPVVMCRATFTGSDDLTFRNPAPSLPCHGFWHEDDFAGLLPWLLTHAPQGADWIRRRYP
ncbi:MAG: VWA domain-containing protein, partial [Thermoactinospora sp.]|nr:VWA domain-containing protein [Thermoactinospora sp.]